MSSGFGYVLSNPEFYMLISDGLTNRSYTVERETTHIYQNMSDPDDDRMDTDSDSSYRGDTTDYDSPIEDTDKEILDLTSDAETYDDDGDVDMADLTDDYSSDTNSESSSDDTKADPPSPVYEEVRWHEGDAILRKIGLERLNEKGYVNLDMISTDRTFGYAGNRALNAARWRAKIDVRIGMYHRVEEPPSVKSKKKGKHRKLDDFHRIHPVFRQDNWSSDDLLIGGYTFNKLKPVLQLATLLLEDETMIGYIFAMLDVSSHKETTLPGVQKRLGRKVHWFEKRNNLSEAEKRTVWDELYTLGQNLWWTDKDMTGKENSLHGYTWGDRGSIEIVLNKRLIDYVCREASPIEDAIDWNPGSDMESARLRVMFNLATTMVHEVMHALWRNKYFPAFEPYYMDTRAAELGFQWEQLLYTGQIDNPTQDRGSPYVSSEKITVEKTFTDVHTDPDYQQMASTRNRQYRKSPHEPQEMGVKRHTSRLCCGNELCTKFLHARVLE
jgi:hypothetical protein